MAKETPNTETKATTTRAKTFKEAAADAPKTNKATGKQVTTNLEDATKVGYLGNPKDLDDDTRFTLHGVTKGANNG